MKDLKEIILEKRVREFKVDGKKVPDKYIAVFNDYLKQIAEKLKTHDRELVKEVCEKIKEQLGFIVDGQERIVCDGSATGDKTILAVLNQIQKEFEK